jgi:hypothetical protein
MLVQINEVYPACYYSSPQVDKSAEPSFLDQVRISTVASPYYYEDWTSCYIFFSSFAVLFLSMLNKDLSLHILQKKKGSLTSLWKRKEWKYWSTPRLWCTWLAPKWITSRIHWGVASSSVRNVLDLHLCQFTHFWLVTVACVAGPSSCS